jgi:gas vesicle protein
MKAERTSSAWLLWGAGCAALGAAVALLVAPQSGSELRESMGDMGRRGGEKGRELAEKIRSMLPNKIGASV